MSYVVKKLLSLVFSEAVLFGHAVRDLLALVPEWIGRSQFGHHAGAQRQSLGHLDVRCTSSYHRL